MQASINVILVLVLFFCRAEGYGQMGHQNRLSLQDRTRHRLNRYMKMRYGHRYSIPSQPAVTCKSTSCIYSSKVKPKDGKAEMCVSDNSHIVAMIKELSTKLDTLLVLQKASMTEVQQADMAAVKKLYVDTTLGELCHNMSLTIDKVPHDCQDIFNYVSKKRGIYEIQPENSERMYAYCEDGWTVIQRREDGSVSFDRTWKEYKSGFGKLKTEFWIGNENLYKITSQKSYKLLVEVGDWSGDRATAIYDFFRIGSSEDLYRLHIGSFIGGSALDGFRSNKNGAYLNNMAFSTRDKDNDNSANRNCALNHRGGWWYNECFFVNLNGYYNYEPSESFAWYPWKGVDYTLKYSKMMIKPT